MRVGPVASWRDLPVEYGPWQTVYGLFRRWQRDGVWSKMLTEARADTAAACAVEAPPKRWLGKSHPLVPANTAESSNVLLGCMA
ncbi:transposase [Streptomyces sp. NPDC057909]|uniref:transposase n=1 Tax=Streptomyces sp. NPDC057909 TaxID=3346277 RepID=UPI0036E08DE0